MPRKSPQPKKPTPKTVTIRTYPVDFGFIQLKKPFGFRVEARMAWKGRGKNPHALEGFCEARPVEETLVETPKAIGPLKGRPRNETVSLKTAKLMQLRSEDRWRASELSLDAEFLYLLMHWLKRNNYKVFELSLPSDFLVTKLIDKQANLLGRRVENDEVHYKIDLSKPVRKFKSSTST